jgi:hypothetical protein
MFAACNRNFWQSKILRSVSPILMCPLGTTASTRAVRRPARSLCQKAGARCNMKQVEVLAAASQGGESMGDLADNAATKLSRRLRAFPEQLRAIYCLVDEHRDWPEVRAATPRRFSTRHLMIFVAVVAMLLGVQRVYHDISYCWARAAYHEDMALFHRGGWPTHMSRNDAARLLAVMRRRPDLAVVHSQMKEKWQQAAACPWLPVEPDPPGLRPTSGNRPPGP